MLPPALRTLLAATRDRLAGDALVDDEVFGLLAAAASEAGAPETTVRRQNSILEHRLGVPASTLTKWRYGLQTPTAGSWQRRAIITPMIDSLIASYRAAIRDADAAPIEIIIVELFQGAEAKGDVAA